MIIDVLLYHLIRHSRCFMRGFISTSAAIWQEEEKF